MKLTNKEQRMRQAERLIHLHAQCDALQLVLDGLKDGQITVASGDPFDGGICVIQNWVRHIKGKLDNGTIHILMNRIGRDKIEAAVKSLLDEWMAELNGESTDAR